MHNSFSTDENDKPVSEIKFCYDITKNDVVFLLNYLEHKDKTQYGKSLTPNTIRKTIEHCRLILRKLIDYPIEGHPLSYPVPHNNPFEAVEFRNVAQMEHKLGICSDMSNCKPRLFECLDCDLNISDVSELDYFEEQVTVWTKKVEQFKDHQFMRENAEYNLLLYQRMVHRTKDAIKSQEENDNAS